jgi:hypothetical protein
MSRFDDYNQIHQAAALYGHVIDGRRWDRLGEVYAEDSVYDSARAGELVGLERIKEYLSTSNQPLIHTGSNLYIELEEGADEATAFSKYIVIRETAIEAGDYTDSWVRTERGWRIAKRASTNRVVAPLGGPVNTASRVGLA